MKKSFLFFFLFFWVLSGSTSAETIKGIFGIPSIKRLHPSTYLPQLKGAGVNAVFVPEDGETIRWFKERGFQVYISINAFGGKQGWKKYPDSRPLKADGTLLGSEPGYRGYGGICPTHEAWRKDRLSHMGNVVKTFGGVNGIDGIWLDFIRYPGLWEVKDPDVPDTCYCKRCLSAFQKDRGVHIPDGVTGRKAALWIRENRLYDWMRWKKRQISSFVEEAKRTAGPLKLGLFVVPWTKGERENAISYKLAQDAFELSRQVDVISPMVYHKMCGQPETWVGYMTRYYKGAAHCQVWPIVQAIACSPEEFGNVLQFSGQAGADGILVFSFRDITAELWPSLHAFQRPKNLIPNSQFQIPEGKHLPNGWTTGKTSEGNVQKSAFLVKLSDAFILRDQTPMPGERSNCLGISAGNDRAGIWSSPLPDCEPGTEYLFTCQFYRKRWDNGIYPSVRLWGQNFYINNHWLTKTFQQIRLYVTCPVKIQDHTFQFINHNPGESIWITRPRLTKNYSFKRAMRDEAIRPPFFHKNFFPIGIYGAERDNLEKVKRLAINTVLIGGNGEDLKKTVLMCHQLGLRYVISVPRDPDPLHIFLNEIYHFVRPQDLAFYVNDEPGIRSFPLNKAEDIQRLIKEKFPEAATCMAIVRPQVCRDYWEASDFFIMDQYPVPSMPMTWLSDSMDRAARDVGRSRLASVIQAFGGERWKHVGWPRMPTWEEMDCLAFLSVIHGSRGIFFFTFKEMGKTEEGRQRIGRVVGRLNRLYPWLVKENLMQNAEVEMISPHQVDPKGRPAVHCCLKKKNDQLLLIATNSIGTYTEAVFKLGDLEIDGLNLLNDSEVKEIFSGMWYPVIKGRLRTKFMPFETKAFLFH